MIDLRAISGEPDRAMISSGTRSDIRPIHTITSLRFFAAVAIVVLHVWAHQMLFLRSGVSFFYVLSGFILVYVHPKIPDLRARGKFWIARLARIWPLHIVTFIWVCLFPFNVPIQRHAILAAIANIFLLQAWIPIDRVALAFNGVSWSLSVEFLFYLLFPILLPWVSKWPVRMVAISVGLRLVLSTMGAWFGLPDGAHEHVPSYEAFVLFNPALHLYKFVFGMALAVWWRNISPIRNLGLPTILEIAAIAAVIIGVPLIDYMANYSVELRDTYFTGAQIEEFLFIPIFGIVIVVFAFQAGLISRFLSIPLLVYLGEISFSIYMLHGLVFMGFERLFSAGNTLSTIGEALLYACAVLALSALSFEVLETPIRKRINRLSKRLL